jgi:carbon-monoxide dehydrogenase large subunit
MLERLVDDAARAVGIDRIELRRRNLIRAFPHRTPLGAIYDSGDYERCLDLALELAGADELGRDAGAGEPGRVAGTGRPDRVAGTGVGLFVERAGGQWESADVEVAASGRVVVRSSASPHGQGHETTFAEIAAARLGISPEDLALRFGDSAEGPPGVGTFGSRSVTVAGSAIVVAIEQLIEHGRRAAADVLDAAPEAVGFAHGRFDARGRTLTLAEVAAAADDGVLRSSARFESDQVFASGAYAAAVEIERSTGRLHVLRLVAVDDAGIVINRLLADGQVIGGAVQGLGECLIEQAEWEEDGQPRFSSLMDYSLLTAAEIPPITTGEVCTPSPLNPLGAKGIGEGGAIGTLPAVANAVADALGGSHVDPPFSDEKLWRALRAIGR